MVRKLAITLFSVGTWLASTAPISGQGLETLGSRAAGLGAFVAVADDASAVAWNPAGLINGPMFNIMLDFGQLTRAEAGPLDATRPAGRGSTTLISLGVPPLGLTYYRQRLTEIVPLEPAAGPEVDRQDRQVGVRSLLTTQLGATLLQSLGAGLTLGTTVKMVRGRVGTDVMRTASWQSAFERAEMLGGQSKTVFDADVGVIYGVGRIRAGLVVRNLREPEFEEIEDGPVMRLQRHIRAGVAWSPSWPGLARTLVSLDADLTDVPHPGGARRDVAMGVERWLRGHILGVRGGLRASTIGAGRPAISAGGSYAVRAGVYVDGYVVRGTADDRGWGVAARLTY
jgi:hypothetical protein